MLNYLKSSDNFFLLAGPCVIEGEQMAMDIAGYINELTSRLNIPYVFKGSYKKANRSRIDSFTGIGDVKALEILRKVKETYNIPVVTDIHTEEEAALAAEYVDILQIPAFLCRQTDLLVAAAAPVKWSISKRDNSCRRRQWSMRLKKSLTPETPRLPSLNAALPSDIPILWWITAAYPRCRNLVYQ